MHSIYRNSDRSPAYLADMVQPASTMSTRRLRSRESGLFDVPRLRTKFGESVLILWSVRVERSPHRHPRRNLHRRFQDETGNFLLFSGVSLHMILFYFISLVTIVMHLRSFSSGGTTKFFNLNLNLSFKRCCE